MERNTTERNAKHDADHGEVRIVDYDAAWATEGFPRWSAAVTSAVGAVEDGALSMGIHHIGSTAVPGLRAKPIIDVLLVVRDMAEFDAHREKLEATGFVWCGEKFVGGRYLYAMGPASDSAATSTVVQCHLHVAPGPLNQRSGAALAFRDALRNCDASRDEYNALKATLAEECGSDRGKYSEGKTAFVMKVLKAAAAKKAAWTLQQRSDTPFSEPNKDIEENMTSMFLRSLDSPEVRELKIWRHGTRTQLWRFAADVKSYSGLDRVYEDYFFAHDSSTDGEGEKWVLLAKTQDSEFPDNGTEASALTFVAAPTEELRTFIRDTCGCNQLAADEKKSDAETVEKVAA